MWGAGIARFGWLFSVVPETGYALVGQRHLILGACQTRLKFPDGNCGWSMLPRCRSEDCSQAGTRVDYLYRVGIRRCVGCLGERLEVPLEHYKGDWKVPLYRDFIPQKAKLSCKKTIDSLPCPVRIVPCCELF
jgi:hypothetical protein